jgi:hypothetical protein
MQFEQFRRLAPISCGWCGGAVAPKHSRQKFCGKSCGDAADLAGRRAANTGGPGKGWSKGKAFVPRKICEQCGQLFYAPPSGVKRGQHRFCSNACRATDVADHPERYPQTNTRRGNGGRREDLGGLYFRSSWEANWARYLNWLVSIGDVREWSYESETYTFHAIKRGSRHYTPDFVVTNKDGSVERHEVKGYMDQRSETKLKRMAKYYPDVKIILIDKAYYYDVAHKVGGIIPNWETTRGKLARKT